MIYAKERIEAITRTLYFLVQYETTAIEKVLIDQFVKIQFRYLMEGV